MYRGKLGGNFTVRTAQAYQAAAADYSGYGEDYTTDYDYTNYAAGYDESMYGAGGYGAGVMGSGATAGGARIASHTSDTSEQSLRSRIFIGNLNTALVGKEQLAEVYGRFGRVKAISVHKGFAFVQYPTEEEARNAISYTDGTSFGGRVVDVNLACEPKNRDPNASGAVPGASRKRPHSESGGARSLLPVPALTQVPISSDADNNGMSAYNGTDYSDSLLCGNCREVFNQWEAFREHRRQPCFFVQAEGVRKAEGEPETLRCFICSMEHADSWNLVKHLSGSHQMTVFDTGAKGVATVGGV